MNNQKLDSIIIRKIKDVDLDELRKLFYNIQFKEFAWIDNEKLILSDFDKSTEGEVVFVAEFNNMIIGFISIWGEDNFIHNLFVHESYRKCGVASKLIEKAIDAFGKPLTLKCVKANKKSVSFYLKNHWKILKEEVGVDGSYFLMELQNEHGEDL